ncbi:MAG: hypothetical protein QM658_03355 [Gordonia sp. (in: high G+C Gram-positive bacteria)]
MPAKTKPITDEQAAKCAAAYAALIKRDERPVVRNLAKEARVAVEAARQWLEVNRPGRDVPEPPIDDLAPMLGGIWSIAYKLATEAADEAIDAERRELLDGQLADAQESQEQTERADAAEARVIELEAALAESAGRVAELESRLAAAQEAAGAAADKAEAADRDRLKAVAERDTLMQVVEAINPSNRTG